jgi:glycerol transport system substrate-binding protein
VQDPGQAFEEITGIKVKHDLIQEGDVVEKLQTSMQSGKSIWLDHGLLIGTHYRYGKIMNPDRLHGGQGQDFNPGLDLKGSVPSSPQADGSVSVADQQFCQPVLVSARTCSRIRPQDKFEAKYGYDLGAELECVKISPSSSASTSRP